MNCRQTFDRATLQQLTTAAFVNGEYARYRENVLFAQQMQKLPETQPYVVQRIAERRNLQTMRDLCTKRRELKRTLDDMNDAIYTLSMNLTPPLDEEAAVSKNPCLAPLCKGFLAADGTCTICHAQFCKECNARTDTVAENHQCKHDDLLTAQALRADSRPCPGCGVQIHKISGCDQMWCVACHVTFSYRTGHKLADRIHNPHYYEFARRGGILGREAGDVPCGGMPSVIELHEATRYNLTCEKTTSLYRMRSCIVNIATGHIDMYAANEENDDPARAMRVLYILGELTETEFKRKLYQNEKKHNRRQAIWYILATIIHAGSDLLRQMVMKLMPAPSCADQLTALFEGANDALRNVHQQYGGRAVAIVNFQLVS